MEVSGSGREALEAFARQKFDMIFMDCHMPGMDGYVTTGAIREMENQQRGHGGARPGTDRGPDRLLHGRETGGSVCGREWMIISASPSA